MSDVSSRAVRSRSVRSRTVGRREEIGPFRSDSAVGLVLRLVAVVGLAVDAWIHVDIASRYAVIGDTVTQEQLFYAEGIGAAVVGLWLLVRGSRLAWQSAFAVGAVGLGLLLLYHHVNVGAIGPIPNMYDPVWSDDKRWSAYGEGAAALAALAWGALELRRARTTRDAAAD